MLLNKIKEELRKLKRDSLWYAIWSTSDNKTYIYPWVDYYIEFGKEVTTDDENWALPKKSKRVNIVSYFAQSNIQEQRYKWVILLLML